MLELTPRQKQILKCLIEEYIDTGTPVGSETLEKKYELGVSPATIRNEMARLTQLGFLTQPHTSAGRIPTSLALKFYIKNLMEERDLSVADEVAIKERIWDHRFEVQKLLKEAVSTLADRTKNLAVAYTNQGDVFHAGYAHILDAPEFYDIDVTRTVLSLLDETNRLAQIFSQAVGEEPVHLLFGEELGIDFLQPVTFIFTSFRSGQKLSGSLGVIASCRCPYSQTIPIVRYFGQLISEISKNW